MMMQITTMTTMITMMTVILMIILLISVVEPILKHICAECNVENRPVYCMSPECLSAVY